MSPIIRILTAALTLSVVSAEESTLWYAQPAAQWTEALPLGNGRLGAMVFGSSRTERIRLNEESLWAGRPAEGIAPDYPKHLAEVQRLILAGKRKEAQDYGVRHLTQRPSSFRSYEPLGNIYLDFGPDAKATGNYRRELSLPDAIARTTYRTAKGTLTREVLISAPADVLAIRVTSDSPGSLDFGIRLSRQKDATVSTRGNDRLNLDGQIVDLTKEQGGPEPNSGGSGPGGRHMRFAGRLIVQTEGGRVEAGENGSLEVSGADSALILFTAATDYNVAKLNFDRSIDPAARAESILERAARSSWEEIRAAHVREHRGLYDRFALQIAPPDAKRAATPTDQRLKAVQEGGEDPGLVELMTHYGRYLLLGSSRRPGRLPANLQGIWSNQQWAPWEADYHLNINLQMNYWPAPLTGLQETLGPLYDWFQPLTVRGQIAAKALYNSDGWVTFHATNPFGRISPSGSGLGSQFINGSLDPLPGAWMAAQLFDAWQFQPDRQQLEKLYPILEGASEFVLDALIECPDGQLRIVPSTSPENTYIDPDTGGRIRITAGSTYHMTLVRAIFDATRRAATILDTGREMRQRIARAEAKLPPIQIGADGRILEWAGAYKEVEPGHRHVSHLLGLHPFALITRETPELYEAARKTIENRLAHGGAATGWSRAWTINFFARLGNGDEAYTHCQALLQSSTLPNLFDTHPPFQIDGNFGFTAGVCEMLLQSHARDAAGNFIVDLLPALPEAWASGSVRGLRTRGNCGVDITWKEGEPVTTTVHADARAELSLRYGKTTRSIQLEAGQSITLHGPDLQVRYKNQTQ